MKEGWSVKTLGEISVMMADGPFGSNLKKEHYTEDHEVRIIQLSNIGEDGWREENTKYTTFKHLETIKRSEVFPDDIVIAKMMPAGRAIICPSHEKRFVLSSDAVKVQIKKGFHLRFILHSINSPYFREQVYETVSGSGRVRTSLTKLRECHLRIPPFAEQQRIADLLDTAFAKIDALKLNAERTLLSAKDLFQATLQRELESKDGWVVKSIAEIADIKGGKRVPKGYKLETERTTHPYIRVADFDDNGSIDLSDIHYISEDVYQGIKRYIIESSDVYISIAGTIGKSGIIPEVLNGANLTENACRLILKKGLYNRFVYYCTINTPFKEQVSKLTMQAAQPKLALTRLATVKVAIPSLQEQYRVVRVLDKLCDNCQSLQDNYTKTLTLCDDLKQSLLRKAFNGDM